MAVAVVAAAGAGVETEAELEEDGPAGVTLSPFPEDLGIVPLVSLELSMF